MMIVETLDQRDSKGLRVDREDLRAALGQRAIVLVGMMGSGKSAVGRGWRPGSVCPSSMPIPRSKRRRA
jgi:hypothetical protein